MKELVSVKNLAKIAVALFAVIFISTLYRRGYFESGAQTASSAHPTYITVTSRMPTDPINLIRADGEHTIDYWMLTSNTPLIVYYYGENDWHDSEIISPGGHSSGIGQGKATWMTFQLKPGYDDAKLKYILIPVKRN